MEFYTIVNERGKFVSPAWRGDEGAESVRFAEQDVPNLFEPFYDTVDKVRELYWPPTIPPYERLDWTGIQMQKVKVEIIS